MTKDAKSPSKDWSELLGENEELYRRSRPKRAKFILEYLKVHCPQLKVETFHEQGAFSGKDIRHIKASVLNGFFCASDLDVGVAGYLSAQGVNALSCDAFCLPFKDSAFDLTYHSGLIICFNNEDAFLIVQEQIRTTKKIAFVFAHNDLSWVDKFASFYKTKIQKKDIFNYRRYREEELLDMASRMGLDAEIYFFDNALMNFLKRNFKRLHTVLSSFSWVNRKFLANEIVMVVRK
ncbi:hypothetical protein [Gilvimarinus polysaccharolyticus]|uniref:hypothetical protein n=1 Tax=Gilvimarinus polysaccharolyticus TaxID=863921 RepID=UPI0012F785A8|nr:hypothetical protein [Gilvimarinus polysaccharolyticus]